MSDYLSDEEQLDKLRNWWQENGLALVGAVVVSIAGVLGWTWYGEHRSEQVARASDLYEEYLEEPEDSRGRIVEALAGEFPESTYRVLVLLREARAAMNDEDPESALGMLKTALAATSNQQLGDLIRLRTARIQQQLDRPEEALATLAGVRSLGFRSQVQELKGDIHFARGERALAHEAYTAAMNEAGANAARPLLRMKVADTADANDA